MLFLIVDDTIKDPSLVKEKVEEAKPIGFLTIMVGFELSLC